MRKDKHPITLTIAAKNMPHGTLVMRTNFPPEDEFFFISAQDQEKQIYFLAEQAEEEEGMVNSNYEAISGDTELDVHFTGLADAINFVKNNEIHNIW